ncbi:integrase [Streptomyces spiroverticillatus]|uniref:Integrase n=1 Tax=Streptomyces finlayi TaxID=67296 RepID=A0A919C9P7_9ACTN|nr:recombinase family protein [Streptomyces finlayi]GHA04416.1 integrase [Streptomyces spiroverticillatus]GHC88472.1 integrase [Streptomyces finlayi]
MTNPASGKRQRIVGVIRLSKETDESTSPERQKEKIEGYARLYDCEIVGWAVDVGVSAKISPWDRPELGPWLAKSDEFDMLVCWKLDRLARSVKDFANLCAWAEESAVTLVCIDDKIDLSSNIGKLVANILAAVAQFELETIKARVLDARLAMRRYGRWSGGDPVYGYKTVPARDHVDGCSWHACDCPPGEGLQVDFDTDALEGAEASAFENGQHIVRRIRAGDSMNSLCLNFERADVLAPSDYKRAQRGKPARDERAAWCPETIRNFLTSHTIRGFMSHDGELVCGDDGMPVKVGPALVTESEWAEIQERLAIKPRTRTTGAGPLLDVGFCLSPDCGLVDPVRRHLEGCTATGKKRCDCPRDRVHGPAKPGKLYQWRASRTIASGRKDYRYHRCENLVKKTCTGTAMTADDLETILEETLLSEVGDLEVTRRTLIPGEDHTEELAQCRDAIQRLTDEKDAAADWDDEDEAVYLSRMGKLRERRKRLAALPQREASWAVEGTGETCRELWARLDWSGRRQWLVESGTKLYAVAPRGGASEFHVIVGEEYRARAVQAAQALAA